MKPVSRNPVVKSDLLWIILLVMLLLLIILAWPDPASGAFSGQNVELTPTTTALPSITPIPVEFLESPDQTSGIICGSVVLVLIIVGGTLGILRARNGKSPR